MAVKQFTLKATERQCQRIIDILRRSEKLSDEQLGEKLADQLYVQRNS